MKIICITGMPLAGKTLAASFAKEKGIEVISMGEKIRKMMEKLNVKDVGNFIIEIREKYGKDIIARECEEDIKKAKDFVIVEGIRSIEEVEYFRKFGEVYILAIHSSVKKRYERAIKRKRNDDPKNFEEFKERDLRELKIGVGNVIALADYMIINEGSIEELRENILKTVDDILKL